MKTKITLLTFFCLFLINCSSNNQDDKRVIMEFKNSEMQLFLKESFNLLDELELKNVNFNDIEWSGYNEKIIAVEGNKVTAKAKGRTTLIGVLKNTSNKALLNITVDDAKISFIQDDLELGLNKESDLNDYLVLEEAEEADVVWSSTNNQIASVKKGVITGKSEGETTITAQVKGKRVKSTINVKVTLNGDKERTSSLLIGASFASPENSWYKNAYKRLGSYNANYADISGVGMVHYVSKIYRGVLYNSETLDKFNHMVIYLSHNFDVYNDSGLRDSYRDYEPIIEKNGYNATQNWDYFIKKYSADCYAQKDNPKSKYYGTKKGKPVSIVVFTHWHDGREVFNKSIRKLQNKWKFVLIELDENIGFTKHQVNPNTKRQVSLDYAADTEVIDGEIYGWHPLRNGKTLYVQDKTEEVFYNTIINL